jgi:hypothetical protein
MQSRIGNSDFQWQCQQRILVSWIIIFLRFISANLWFSNCFNSLIYLALFMFVYADGFCLRQLPFRIPVCSNVLYHINVEICQSILICMGFAFFVHQIKFIIWGIRFSSFTCGFSYNVITVGLVFMDSRFLFHMLEN